MKTIQAIFYKLKCQQKYSFFVFAFIFLFTLLYTSTKELYLYLSSFIGFVYLTIGFQVSHGQQMIMDREIKFIQTFKLMGLNDFQYFTGYVLFHWFLIGTQLITLFLLCSLVDYLMFDRLNSHFVQMIILLIFASFQSSCIGAFCSFGIKKLKFASFFLAITQYVLFVVIFLTALIQNEFLKELFGYLIPQNFMFNQLLRLIANDHIPFNLPYLKALTSSIIAFAVSYSIFYLFNLKFSNIIDMVDYRDTNIDLEQNLITDGLKITDVNHYFGDFQALKNINMFVKEGEFVCLMGHNGAGKSTLINVLTGIHEPTSGKIELNGQKFNPEKLHIGVCPAYDVLFDNMKVREQIKTIALLKSKPIDIEKLIEIFGLQDYEDMNIKELSGGYKRRVMMAICSMGNPDILFLDEPTSAIDAESRVFLWKVLKENKKKNKNQITFLTTHHLEEAEYLSDNISVLVKGKIYITDNIENIKKVFGVGYKINVFTDNKQFITDVKNQFQFIVDDDLVQEKTKVVISIPFRYQDKIIEMLSYLKDNNLEYSLNSNTLEQSYIDIEKQAHFEQYQGSKQKAIEIVKNLFVNKTKSTIQYTLFMLKETISINILTILLTYIMFGGITYYFFNKSPKQKSNLYQILYYFVYFEIIIMIYIPLEYLSERVNHIKRLMFTQKVSIINYYLTKLLTFSIRQFISYVVLFILLIFSIGKTSDYAEGDKSTIFLIIFYMFLRSIVFFNVSALLQFIWVDKKYLVVYFIILYLIINDLSQLISQKTQVQFVQYIFGLNLLREQIKDYDMISFKFPVLLQFILTGFIYFLIVQVLELYWNNYNYIRSKFDQPIKSDNKLEIRKLYKKYDKYVVKNFNMDFKKGHYSGLLGPNGAGKSTVIKMILNQQLKSKGSMRFNDNQNSNSFMSLFKPSQIIFNNNNLACVFQENSIFQKKKVEEIISFFSKLNNCNEEQVQNLLKYFYMDIYKNNQFDELSSGNQRKLCIFISLLINPDFIVFDEATCGIDLMMRLKLKDLFDEFKNNGASGVFTTHFLKDIEIFCDHLCIIKNGNKIKDDSLDNIRKDESSYIVRIKFITNPEEQEENLNKKGYLRFNEVQFQDEYITTIDYHFKRVNDLCELLQFLLDLQKNQKIKEFEIRQYTIDDIYVKILKEN